MSVIYDLKNENDRWAESVNADLSKDCPEYINKYGRVGSEKWWENYDSGNIPSSNEYGEVNYIGSRKDYFNEEWGTVEINTGSKIIEYDNLGYWKSEEIIVGAEVSIESFEIKFKGKNGPMNYIFIRLVQVSET